MRTPHTEYLAMDATHAARSLAYRKLVGEALSSGLIAEIRNAADTGLVLGNERFRNEGEQLTGQRQHHRKRSPLPKTQLNNEEFLL